MIEIPPRVCEPGTIVDDLAETLRCIHGWAQDADGNWVHE